MINIEDAENSLLSKIDKPKEFFTELSRILRKEYQEEIKQLPKLIVKMNKENNIDFCLIAVDAINDGFSCFDVSSVLEGALSDLNLYVTSVLRLTERLFEGMQGDMIAHTQFKPFEKIVAKQPEFSRELLSAFLKQDKPYVVGYISNIYQRLSKKNEHEIHKELCELKDHKSQYVLMAAADALGMFDYKSSKNRKLIKKTLEVLQDLEEKKSNDINRILVFSYMRLLEYSDYAKMKIIEFSRSDQMLVRGGVSNVVFLAQEEHGDKKWFSDVLLNLSNTSCDDKGIINNIDSVLAGLVKNNNWSLSEEFFITWLQQSDYHSKKDQLSIMFSSTLFAFINKRSNFERLLTTFFNHDDFVIHKAASEMISYCQTHKITNLKLDKKTLKLLSIVDCVYICRKILGYVISSEELCSLCFSILEASPMNKDIQELVYDIFRNHIGEDYPGSTIKFLKSSSLKSKSKNIKRVASDIIADIDAYCSLRDSLPRLKELAAPKQKSQQLFREKNKKMKAAIEKAQKSSFISMIASKIILKQGTGSFNFMDGKYSSISKLGSYSAGVEMPQTEITQPVDAALIRFNFRLAKRGSS